MTKHLMDEIDADSRICCIVSPPCCNPPGQTQIKSLAHIIWAGSGLASETDTFDTMPEWATSAATVLYERLDFVPKGAGSMVLQVAHMYSAFFKKEAENKVNIANAASPHDQRVAQPHREGP